LWLFSTLAVLGGFSPSDSLLDAVAELESKNAMRERASKGTPAREGKKHGNTLPDAPSGKVKPKPKDRKKETRARLQCHAKECPQQRAPLRHKKPHS
jgi:hypothetical protein